MTFAEEEIKTPPAIDVKSAEKDSPQALDPPSSASGDDAETQVCETTPCLSMGWIYWFSWAITFALELTVSGLIIQHWNSSLSIGIFIAVFWVVITLLNFLPVSFYGELEFWFAGIKVITVLGFMIFAICIDAGAGQHGYLGFHTWTHPGPFAPYLLSSTGAVAKFVGFWAVLMQAGFSYQGTELIGIAAGETDNPRKTVPSAIRKTFYRILLFFVLTIFFIGLLVPHDDPALLSAASDASASPFVIAANLAGVKVLPGLINAVLLCVVLSAANSNVYSGSRIVLGLAQEGLAPTFFKRTSAGGVPHAGGEVFGWLLNITAVAGFIDWACINLCHLCFMKALAARGVSRETLPFRARWQLWFAYYGVFFNVLVILTQGFTAFIPWNTTRFFVAYVSLMLFVVLYAGHKVLYKTNFVTPELADLDTGRREVDAMEFEDKPTTLWGKCWAWLG